MKTLTAALMIVLITIITFDAKAQQYYKYQSNNNGLSVSYPAGLKVTADDEIKLEIEDDRMSFSALFCDASTITQANMKENLEKVLKKTGIDRKSVSIMELKKNETIEGCLYIGGNKAENADYYLIYGFVQSKLSPQIAFKISLVCNGDLSKEAGVMLGTLEFRPDEIK
ncbi:MAG: hypothetical protein J6Y24_05530 [Bacteroidales bacterium]|nr:hypothetical protein [Bacteroidales bacterium]